MECVFGGSARWEGSGSGPEHTDRSLARSLSPAARLGIGGTGGASEERARTGGVGVLFIDVACAGSAIVRVGGWKRGPGVWRCGWRRCGGMGWSM